MLIIHEYGAPSHYLGAVEFAKERNEKVSFREFSTLKLIYRGVKKRDFHLIKKALYDFFYFMLYFIFPKKMKNMVVIIGIAPLNWRVIFFNRMLKHANVIYHTSWHVWDGSKYPHPTRLFNKYINLSWDFFLNNIVNKIAAVTECVKEQLVLYKNIDKSKIQVVYHSYDEKIYFYNNKFRSNDIVYVGRLVESKGISEILKISESLPNLKILFIGDGCEKETIKRYSIQNKNIEYLGYLNNKSKISEVFNNTKFLILPSKRIKDWEELFGMVIIEAMACGCIPLCTDHNGPKAILNNALEKNIFPEKEITENIKSRLLEYFSSDEELRSDMKIALKTAKKYSAKEISKKWQELLNG
ncbi:glycosyltransferase family 4 protein [Acinetobacter soli]|uniref:glycosyltransferase family 4 protein n=1 Tax=Acinetobacter soli TaxID=487316 RepID=UPI003AA81BD8